METVRSPEDHFRRGRALLEQGEYPEALEELRAAHSLEPGRADVRSYLGLCVGVAEGDLDFALELCQSAAKQEFYNPDLYLNLALLHLTFERKADALRFLRRGQMIDPGSVTIRAEIERLGRRRRPVLGFLPRGHRLNRWLGRARDRLRPDDEAA